MDCTKLDQLQGDILIRFREAVGDCPLPDSSDIFLLRWLVARDFDVAKAEKMLRASVEWRRQCRIDTLVEDFRPPEVLRKFYAAGRVGSDKRGNPLWIIRYGNTDMKGLLNSVKKKDFFKYALSLIEQNAQVCNTWTTKTMKTTTIFDCENLSIRQISHKPSIQVAIEIVQCYEANYPEYLQQIFVINAPDVFAAAFALIKPFLSEKTAQKIKVFPSGRPQRWKEAILQEVNADQLPLHYGGTMTDPDGDPQCPTKVSVGGAVPKSYYFSNQFQLNRADEKILTVANRSKEQLQFHVGVPDSTLRWRFYCKEGDIEFAIYQRNDNRSVAVVAKDRVDCHVAPEVGRIRIGLGQYVVEFDNSFSYLRSKVIRYAISVDSLPIDTNV